LLFVSIYNLSSIRRETKFEESAECLYAEMFLCDALMVESHEDSRATLLLYSRFFVKFQCHVDSSRASVSRQKVIRFAALRPTTSLFIICQEIVWLDVPNTLVTLSDKRINGPVGSSFSLFFMILVNF